MLPFLEDPGRLPGTGDAVTVIDRLTALVQTVPGAVKASITWDQGVEMTRHVRSAVSTGARWTSAPPTPRGAEDPSTESP